MHTRLPILLFAAWIDTAAALHGQNVASVRTTADLTHVLESGPTLHFVAQSPPSATRATELAITVDDTQRFQVMEGFGASLTDGSAWLLEEKLKPAQRDAVMTKLFSPTGGIGLSFLRQPIGSEDLSRSHFNFDDMPAGQTDPQLQHFSAAHDDAYVFPAVREALKLNPAITVMATPWSPPAWMKTKDSMDGGGLRPEAMPAFAAYLTRSIEAFAAAGIPVKYLTVQNEPLHDTKDFPGTLMLSDQAARLIGDDLGPDLVKSGLQTKVLAYDHNWDHPEYPEAILSDPKAAPFVAGSALHCYGGDVSAQNGIHARFPEKGIWLTECSGGEWDKEAPLVKTGRLLLESTRDWAKAVVLWGMVLDTDHGPHDGGCDKCRALVAVDLKQSPVGVTYTGDYYGLGQASRFVHPGAVRIASDSFGITGLQTVAFQNPDGSIALLALNNKTVAASFSVRWHGSSFTTQLEPSALATYTWKTR